MGTVEYMSPEQVSGLEVDQRTDLFSFGAVLYEMATGVKPFPGNTMALIFNAILSRTPTPPASLNPAIPEELERTINQALEKNRELRYQSAENLLTDLKRLKRDTETGRVAIAEGQGRKAEQQWLARRWKWALGGVVLLLLAGIGMTWLAKRNSRPAPPLELKETRLTANPREYGAVGTGSISPDGAQIVYLAGDRIRFSMSEIWLMGAQGENPRKFLTVQQGEVFDQAVWSPDGQRIAYKRRNDSGGFIESRNLKGEQLTTILSDPKFSVWGFWWFANGRMVFATPEPEPNQNDFSLWEIQVDPKSGRPLGPPRRITKWAGNFVSVINGTADGKRLIVMRTYQSADVFVGELEANGRRLKNPRRLTLDERNDVLAAWARDSKTVIFHSNRNGQFDIFKQALDQETAEPVVTGPGDKWFPILSPDGNLILYPQDVGEKARIMRVPITGGPPEMVPEIVLEGRPNTWFLCSGLPSTRCVLGEESPDRKQYIFTEFDPLKGRGRELTRVTLVQTGGGYLFWDLTRDGTRIAFAQDRGGIGRRIQILPLSGGKTREVNIQREIQMTSLAWANDGRGFYVATFPPSSALFFVDVDGSAEILWKKETLVGFTWRSLPSPDGRHLAMTGWSADSNVWMLENF
jgi:Tol biopolymer transport system component